MFDTKKLFSDVSDMIQATASQKQPVAEAMQTWLQYCRDAAPDKQHAWRELAELDFESDFRLLTTWIHALLRAEPLPQEVNGLWFGLYNPILEDDEPTCQLYFAGSKRFEKSNLSPDWHCRPEYWPQGRYARSDVLTAMYRKTEAFESDESYLGECCLCHGYVAAVLSRWCAGDVGKELVGPDNKRAIAFGHDSGDFHFIHLPQ